MRRVVTRDVLQDEDLPILEWQLLFSVARFGSCHLAYITRRTSIDPAHGSRAAAVLERKGLITRREDPENKRRKLISLTPSGIECFERIWPQARQTLKSVTDQLNPRDFEELKRLLDLLNAAVEQLVDPDGPCTVETNSTKEDEAAAAHAQ